MMIYLVWQNEMLVCELRRCDNANQKENNFFLISEQVLSFCEWRFLLFFIIFLQPACLLDINCGPEFVQVGGF